MRSGAVRVSAFGNTPGTGAGSLTHLSGRSANLRSVFPRVDGNGTSPIGRTPVATLEIRTSPTGTSYRVKWREDGAWQSETFGGDRKAAALRFQRDVEQHGNRWPTDWIRGAGYRQELTEPTVPDSPLLDYALQFVADKTGVQPDTRQRYARQVIALALQLSEIITADPRTDATSASILQLTDRHVAQWINARERDGASPKTIANWHGLGCTKDLGQGLSS